MFFLGEDAKWLDFWFPYGKSWKRKKSDYTNTILKSLSSREASLFFTFYLGFKMQIKSIKISNLLSFSYMNEKEFENQSPISFYGEDLAYQGVKIFIGNNASGKSNFIKILEEFFTILIKDFSFDNSFSDAEEIPTRKAIKERNILTKYLQTNNQTPDQPSKLEIALELSNTDYENIWFVCKYSSRINSIIDKYSKLDFRFPEYKYQVIVEQPHELKLEASFDEKLQKFIINESKLDEYQLFVLSCIRYQKLLQIVITIFNQYEKKPEERKRYLLKRTFAILNNDRSQLNFKNFINPHEIINDLEYSRNSLVGYTGCIYKIRSILENFTQEALLSSDISTQEKAIEERLKKSDFFVSLNYMIQKYFDKQLRVDYVNGMIGFYMVDENDRVSYFNDLSDGEKSLLTMIFWLYGNDLTDGFMIVNEPELHLHPQYQKELAEVCDQISEHIGAQFILSTNSPLFINEKNLTSVYRMYKNKNQNSLVSAPRINVDYDDATLMHMLRFENLSKLFFVDKIILVEGDTDAYFFSFYLNYLKTFPEWKNKIRDYEIININGKGSFWTRRKFLRKFNIKNYFIGDWDNTVDYGFFSRAELNRFYMLANKQAKTQKSEKRYSDYYNRLVKTILTFAPKKHKAIIKGIEKLYNDKVFILKEGAIETYVPLEKKGLSYMAYFCNAYFYDRILNQNFKEQRKELNQIMKIIFND